MASSSLCGLSKPAFTVVSKSTEDFYCPHCKLSKLNDLILSLQASIKVLETKVTSTSCSNVADAGACPPTNQLTNQLSQTATKELYKDIVKYPSPKVNSDQSDRRFNIVIQGIDESPQGTQRHLRQENDLNSIAEVISSTDCMVDSTSIRDHFRLGKYRQDHIRPRPILVKFNRTSEVSNILSKRSSLSRPLSIKPDLPPDQRLCESALLKERWSLLNSGSRREEIKIRGKILYLNNIKYATFNGTKLIIYQPHEDSSINVSSTPNMSISNNIPLNALPNSNTSIETSSTTSASTGLSSS